MRCRMRAVQGLARIKRVSVNCPGLHPGYNSVGHHRTVARMEAAGRNPGRDTVINFFNTTPDYHPR